MKSGNIRSLATPILVPDSEPDLAEAHKEAVLQAIRWAWSELVTSKPEALRSDDEESITCKLQELLNMRKNGGRLAIWLTDFETVTRGESQCTSDGRIQKKPDLTFRPVPYRTVTNQMRWGWFVECKIINGLSSLNAYRDKGIQRFCDGEYAPFMCSAAMLAYVRDASTPGTALPKLLSKHRGIKKVIVGPIVDQTTSEHDRSSLSIPCLDLTLRHLWLKVPVR